MRDSIANETDPSNQAHQGVGYRRRSRFGRRLLVFVTLLLVLVFLAPIILSRTELRKKIVPWLLPDLAGEIEVGETNLSWFSRAQLKDVRVTNDDGDVLFESAMIESEKTLGQMALRFRDVGKIRLTQPQLQIALDQNGTNWDSFLASLEGDDHDGEEEDFDEDFALPTSVGVEIADGTIRVKDLPTGEEILLDDINLALQAPRGNSAPIAVKLTANALHREKQGQVTADFLWNQPRKLTEHDLGSGELKFETSGLSLAALMPFYRRAELDLRTDGDLTGTVVCQWDRGSAGPDLQANGALTVANANVQFPSVLGSDTLQSPVLTFALESAIQQEELQIHKLDAESDYGQFSVRGKVPLSELFAADIADKFATWQSRHQLRANGQFDLRKLAMSLPETMRLRDDTSVVGGTIVVSLDSANTESDARNFVGDITTADIVATTGGKTFSWTQPMEVHLQAHSRPSGYIVDRLTCSSDFFQATAAGTLQSGSFSTSGDLDKLAAQLSQFCDLGVSRLAGKFTGDGSWTTSANQEYEAAGLFNVQDFELNVAELAPWQEQQLILKLKALGQADQQKISRIDNLEATIESGNDFFSAKLTSPITDIALDAPLPVDCKLRGQLGSWLARVSPFVKIEPWQLSGSVVATATGTVSRSAAFLNPVSIEMSDFKAVSQDNLIAEPTIRATGQLEWDSAQSLVSMPTLEVVSSALALRAQQARVITADSQLEAAGSAAFRGDLGRLGAWLQRPNEPATQNFGGKLEGTLNVSTQDGLVSFQANSNCADFQVAGRKTIQTQTMGPQSTWAEIWREAQLQLAAKGQFNNADSTLQLEQIVVTGDAAQIQATGAIRQVPNDPIADLRGEVDYDLLGLLAKVRNWVGPEIQIKGRKRQPFSLRGPLTVNSLRFDTPSSQVINASATTTLPVSATTALPAIHPELSAETTLGWDSANAYGFEFGPQNVAVLLQNGVVSTSPLNTQLSGGQISLAPRVDLTTGTPALILDQNTSAKGVRLTPQMCDEWIKYVAPLLAGTATADGQFSMQMGGARIPFSAPMMGEASGVVVIEQARMQPGPVAQQLLETFRQASTLAKASAPSLSFLEQGNNWIDIQQQQVEFRMVQGRVYHRNMALKLGNVTVQTSGSVGMDQSISMVAQIPVNEDWIKDEQILASLQGQMIQIPIHGSLSSPRLDRRAFAQLSQQIIGQTAERMLHNELEKGLKKLLGPK